MKTGRQESNDVVCPISLSGSIGIIMFSLVNENVVLLMLSLKAPISKANRYFCVAQKPFSFGLMLRLRYDGYAYERKAKPGDGEGSI